MKHETLTDSSPMPWGKHKGTPMKEVPASYLLWCYEQPWIGDWPAVHAYLKKHEDQLMLERVEDDNEDEGFHSYDDYRDYRGF